MVSRLVSEWYCALQDFKTTEQNTLLQLSLKLYLSLIIDWKAYVYILVATLVILFTIFKKVLKSGKHFLNFMES